MVRTYSLTVAPNGAYLCKSTHSAFPTAEAELVETAKSCFDAGAGMIHLHVREDDESHSLDAARYRSAIAAIQKAVPEMAIQITTESGGKYEVAEQLSCLRDVSPDAASVAAREIARDETLVKEFYHSANELGVDLQHIVYSPEDFDMLMAWIEDGTVPGETHDILIVLGRYTDGKLAKPEDLDVFLPKVENSRFHWTVCAFGKHEQACLIAALQAGGNARIGFENNTVAPDGTVFPDNTASVASFVRAAAEQGFETKAHSA